MARNEDIALQAGVWTQLTNANAASVRISLRTGQAVELQATNGTTPPATASGSVPLTPFGTLAADLTLADLWPGVSGANRLWALSPVYQTVSVSHADA
jgi:hypothetical protein